MSEFKVGDRVRLRRDMPTWPCISHEFVEASIKENRVYTIASMSPAKYGIMLKPNDGYGFSADELELVEEQTKSAPEFGTEASEKDQAYQRRIQELLEANNALVEREREAKRAVRAEIAENEALKGRVLALREQVENLKHENASQAAQLEKLERNSADNMPSIGTILWITNGGVIHIFDRANGAWTPTPALGLSVAA